MVGSGRTHSRRSCSLRKKEQTSLTGPSFKVPDKVKQVITKLLGCRQVVLGVEQPVLTCRNAAIRANEALQRARLLKHITGRKNDSLAT